MFENLDLTTVPIRPTEPLDRLTMKLDVYYEHTGDQPTHVPCVAWRTLEPREDREQPYLRRRIARPNWEPIIDEGCWIDTTDVGIVVVSNTEGTNLSVHPTDEERVKIASRIIEIRLSADGPAILVHPGWSQSLELTEWYGVLIRCSADSARYRLTVFPR